MKTKTFFDAKTRKLISFRDGVQEYFGIEIGKTPHDKVFTVYRDAETVRKASEKMPALDITEDHISLDSDPEPASIGTVITSEVIEAENSENGSTVAVQNTVAVKKDVLEIISTGKRELSLGYNATLAPHSGEYDFVQTDIEPHHLAIVDAGRCGSICTFTDKKDDAIMSEEKTQEVKDIGGVSPDVIKALSAEELRQLQAMISELLGEESKDEEPKEEVKDEDKEESKDECKEDIKDEDKEEVKDEDKEEEKQKATDSRKFEDAVLEASRRIVRRHIEAMEKAKDFLPEDYNFIDATPCKIMRDAIATQTDENFQDAEVEAAFKMLKKSAPDYSNFGKQPADGWAALTDKEL